MMISQCQCSFINSLVALLKIKFIHTKIVILGIFSTLYQLVFDLAAA